MSGIPHRYCNRLKCIFTTVALATATMLQGQYRSPGFSLGYWTDVPLMTDGGGDYQSNLGVSKLYVKGPIFSWNGKLTPWLFAEPAFFVGNAAYIHPENAREANLQSKGYGWSLSLIPRIRLQKVYFGLGVKTGITYIPGMYNTYTQQKFTGQFKSLGLTGRFGYLVHKNWMVELRADYAGIGSGNYEYFTGSNGFGISIIKMRDKGHWF